MGDGGCIRYLCKHLWDESLSPGGSFHDRHVNCSTVRPVTMTCTPSHKANFPNVRVSYSRVPMQWLKDECTVGAAE